MENPEFFGELRSLCAEGITSPARFAQVKSLLAEHRDRGYIEQAAVEYVLHFISEEPLSSNPEARSPFHTYYPVPLNADSFCASVIFSLSVTLDCFQPSTHPVFDYDSFFKRHPLKRAQSLTLLGQDFHTPSLSEAFGSLTAPHLRFLTLQDLSLGPAAYPQGYASQIYDLLAQFPTLEVVVLHENYLSQIFASLILHLESKPLPSLKVIKYGAEQFLLPKSSWGAILKT